MMTTREKNNQPFTFNMFIFFVVTSIYLICWWHELPVRVHTHTRLYYCCMHLIFFRKMFGFGSLASVFICRVSAYAVCISVFCVPFSVALHASELCSLVYRRIETARIRYLCQRTRRSAFTKYTCIRNKRAQNHCIKQIKHFQKKSIKHGRLKNEEEEDEKQQQQSKQDIASCTFMAVRLMSVRPVISVHILCTMELTRPLQRATATESDSFFK